MPVQLSRQITAAHCIVILVVIANAVTIFPETSIGRFPLNDSVFHITMTQRMVQAIERGENPLDSWVPEWTFGYPVSRTYQPLGHILLALTYTSLGGAVPLKTIFVWWFYILICSFPVTVYIAARLLLLPRTIAAACALVSPLISTNGLYGLDYGSYLWRGSGLFTQALAMHLVMLSLGQASRAIRGKGSGVLCGVLAGLTFLSHFVYGYIAAISIGLFAIIPNSATRAERALRLVIIGVAALALTAFQLVPAFLDAPFINHSRWEPTWKWDSFGASQILRMLVSGELMDYGRLPVLTALALFGVATCVVSSGRRRLSRGPAGFVVLGGGVWLALFFGRPTWGFLIDLFGARYIPLHRLIGAVHVFAILLSGIALGMLWELAKRGNSGRVAAVLLTSVLILPAVLERREFLSKNREWGEANVAAFEAEKGDIEQALATVKKQGGRVYPGLAAGWGRQFQVGSVPFYAMLSGNGIPAVAFLYHAMALTSEIMVLFDETNPVHYRLFNITSVAADTSRELPAFIGPFETFGRFRIARAPGGGYFDVVSIPYSVVTDKQNFFDINSRWLQTSWPGLRQHLLLDFGDGIPVDMQRLKPVDTLPTVPSNEVGMVESEQVENETYRAVVDLNQPGYALFKMTFHPNWRAAVDGEIRRTVMLSPGFTGVAIGAGRHEIEFRYEPGVMKTVLLGTGILALLILAAMERSGAVMRLEKKMEPGRPERADDSLAGSGYA